MEKPPQSARQVSVTKEQGEKEWRAWQEQKKGAGQPEEMLPTLRPEVMAKISDSGDDLMNLLTREEKQNLYRYLEAYASSDRPKADIAHKILQFVDLERPITLPPEQHEELKKLIGG